MTESLEGQDLGSAKALQRHFFVPPPDHSLLTAIAEEKFPPEFAPAVDAFVYSVNALVETASMPFSMAQAAASAHHFQGFRMAESIRAQNLDPRPGEPDEALEERRSEEATKKAQQKFREFLGTAEGSAAVIRNLSDFLMSGIERGSLLNASRELLLQSTVTAWSAFEVLAKDVMISLLSINFEVQQ